MFGIYALIDPTTLELRYVGRTKMPLGMRLIAHVRDARSSRINTPKSRWIAEVLAAGRRPEIVELERVGQDEMVSAEEFWIGYFKSIGARLTNDSPPHGGAFRSYVVSWTPEILAMLGKVADSVIAEMLGVSRKAVTYHRKTRGIPASYDRTRNSPPPPMGGWNTIKLPEHVVSRLGKEPDHVLGKEFGCNKTTIARARRRLGIAPCATTTGKTGRFLKGQLNGRARWPKRGDTPPARPARIVFG